MRIPAADLHAQHAPLREELIQAFTRVLDASAFVGGAEVEAFEREFAAFCGVRHAVGVANGTDALTLALRAAGVGNGDRVAVPAFTFAAAAEAVCLVGATPVFVDVERDTLTLDPAAFERAVERGARLRAVIPVHLYGCPAAMERITAIASAAGALVIEDAAQAHGARYGRRRAGALGQLGCFSFYPTKNLAALGDAGAVTTDDDALAAHLRRLRDHGQQAKYVHAEIGTNSRLDGVQAACLRVKLQRLPAWNARRQALANRYRERLRGVPGLQLPVTPAPREHVFHLFVIRSGARDALRAWLAECGITAAIHYPLPLHLQPALAAYGGRAGDCPVAEAAAAQVLALPLYPELSDAAVDHVCAAVERWARARAA